LYKKRPLTVQKLIMEIQNNTVVSITYDLKIGSAEGALVEKVDSSAPFVFLFGAGGLLPEFEENLHGLTAGKSFEFTIESDNAYGPVQEEAIIELPLSIFEVDGLVPDDLLVVGRYLTMQDHQGNPLRGKIEKVGAENVTMDFNHPLAGADLHFKGGVESIREATEEELAHGHVHGEGGHHH
jgi:FKBP-type peptidyl-prolyl cis-trans isomerase SlyD